MPALANSLTWERWYPGAVAVLAAGRGAAFDPDRLAVPPQLLRGTVSLGALAFGSVGVSLAVLAGLDSPFMRRIRRTSYVIVLRRYVGWALLGGLALALVGLAGPLPGGAPRPPATGPPGASPSPLASPACTASGASGCFQATIPRTRLIRPVGRETPETPRTRPRTLPAQGARAADVRSGRASSPCEHMSE